MSVEVVKCLNKCKSNGQTHFRCILQHVSEMNMQWIYVWIQGHSGILAAASETYRAIVKKSSRLMYIIYRSDNWDINNYVHLKWHGHTPTTLQNDASNSDGLNPVFKTGTKLNWLSPSYSCAYSTLAQMQGHVSSIHVRPEFERTQSGSVLAQILIHMYYW